MVPASGIWDRIRWQEWLARTDDTRFWRPVLYQLSYTPAGRRQSRTAADALITAGRLSRKARLRVLPPARPCRPVRHPHHAPESELDIEQRMDRPHRGVFPYLVSPIGPDGRVLDGVLAKPQTT